MPKTPDADATPAATPAKTLPSEAVRVALKARREVARAAGDLDLVGLCNQAISGEPGALEKVGALDLAA